MLTAEKVDRLVNWAGWAWTIGTVLLGLVVVISSSRDDWLTFGLTTTVMVLFQFAVITLIAVTEQGGKGE